MTPEQKDTFINLVEKLSAADQATLLRFAEFLSNPSSNSPAQAVSTAAAPTSVDIPEPKVIPRPAEERVVAAVKRLSTTYFMLDKKKMLGVTSDLVTQHVLQGRDAVEVIDELEDVFHQHYRQLKQDGGDS
jgi:hypothetical protein